MDNLLWDSFGGLTSGMIVDIRTVMLSLIFLMVIFIAYKKIQMLLNPPNHDSMIEESYGLRNKTGILGEYHNRRFNSLMARKVHDDIEGDW